MKTAMQELIEDLQKEFSTQWGHLLKVEAFEQFLEKEKEQIEQTFDNGVYHARYFREDEEQLDGEDYYNQTYKQSK